MLNIKVLKALNGDCIVITYGKDEMHHIIIDGGQGKFCFRQLSSCVNNIKKARNKIDLLILTHIDSDHIDGVLRLLSQREFDYSLIEEMWFNFGKGLQDFLEIEYKNQNVSLYTDSTEISWRQGELLEEKVQKEGIRRKFVTKLEKLSIGEADITILSPSKRILKKFAEQDENDGTSTAKIAYKDDYQMSILELNQKEPDKNITITNKSSIAFLFEYNKQSLLLLGDANADEIVNSLRELGYSKDNKLKVDYCKIAHHASRHNTTNELIQILDCSNYIISTHQTAQGRPSKECLSRIICNSENPVNFYCNYKLDFSRIFTEEEFYKYGIKCIVLDEHGIDVGE